MKHSRFRRHLKDAWRDWYMLALAGMLLLATLAVCCAEEVLPERVGIEDMRATARLGKEVQKLRKEMPLPWEVQIVVVHRDCQAWADIEPRRQIIILDAGEVENRKRLRHEWTHFHQHAQKRPMWGAKAETECRAAER